MLAAVWLPPLVELLPPFTAHMTRHMVVVALAAPLLAVSLTWLRRVGTVNPIAASAVEFVLVWSWHLPALHHFARTTWAGTLAEQASFLLSGVLVWASCLRGNGDLVGAAGLLLTSMHMTLLGALLVLAPRSLYAHGTLADQQIGGMLMLSIGTPVYIIAALWVTAQAFSRDEPA
jgi:putative membrane protein